MGIYHCWHCGKGGRVKGLIAEAANMEFRTEPEKPKRTYCSTDPGELVPLHELSDSHQAIVYLKNRGFDPSTLEKCYGIAYCSRGKKFAGGVFDTTNTIAIPLYEGGKTVGWQCRLLYDPAKLTEEECGLFGFKLKPNGKHVRPPKYFTSPGLQKSSVLFNEDWALNSKAVVVTEGVFDAIAVGLCGVATLGKQVSDDQIKRLGRWRLVILLLDPDAEKDQNSLAGRFQTDVLVVQVHLKGYKDAGECPRGELWRQISEAVDTNPYLARNGVTLASFNPLIEP